MDIITSLTRNISSIATKRSAMVKSNLKLYTFSYTFSEMHTIDYIGKNERPNVTRIAKHLEMTRGAISKIVKRLIKNNHIESYKIKSNKKEIYFKLTAEGRQIFSEHREIHDKVHKIDSAFFSQVDDKLLKSLNQVLTDYNEFLLKNADVFKNE